MPPEAERGEALGAPEGAPGGPSVARPEPRRIRVPIPFSLSRVNVYLLPGAPLTLVDTGPDTEEAYFAVRDALAEEGFGIASLERIALSHSHVDHAGLAARLQAESGARVLAHPKAIDALRDWPATWASRVELVDRAARAGGAPAEIREAFVDGARGLASLGGSLPPDTVDPLPDEALVRLGGGPRAAPAWRAHYTPGHAPDHLCFLHEPSGAMFAGDLMLRRIPTVPLLEPRGPDGLRPHTLRDLLGSWRRVGRLPVDIAWSGHGAPVRAHRVLLARRLASTRAGLLAARQALREGAVTLWEIAEALELDLRPDMLDVTMGVVVARMDWLVERELVERRLGDGLLRFRALR